jgi:hypothetical protein
MLSQVLVAACAHAVCTPEPNMESATITKSMMTLQTGKTRFLNIESPFLSINSRICASTALQ